MRSPITAAFLCSLTLAGSALAQTAPAPAAVRTFPHAPLHIYPLDSARGVQSLLLPNAAVVNNGGAPITVDSLLFEVMRGGEVMETRTLHAADLERSAKGGAGLQASGMMGQLGFLFGDVLGAPDAKLAASPALGAGQGLLVTNQIFAWTGARDSLRVTARAADGTVLGQSTVAIDSAPPQARYLFPLAGRLYVQAGPSPHTHHRWAPPEAFAYDIVRLADGGATHSGDGMKFTDYAVYGASIRAAADGEVVAVVSDQIEDPAQFRRPDETTEAYFGRIQAWQAEGMARGGSFLAGNYVVIRHPWGEYSVYVHMKPGSARVKPGQTVKAGAVIGQVGSSGSSTEPHLHFQVCDSPARWTARAFRSPLPARRSRSPCCPARSRAATSSRRNSLGDMYRRYVSPNQAAAGLGDTYRRRYMSPDTKNPADVSVGGVDQGSRVKGARTDGAGPRIL